jgi:hypothetical protein
MLSSFVKYKYVWLGGYVPYLLEGFPILFSNENNYKSRFLEVKRYYVTLISISMYSYKGKPR